MEELSNPTVEWAEAWDPGAALLVLLHGWGESEGDMLERSRLLPSRFSYASVGAPYSRGRHRDWFAAGRSFESTRLWFEEWLDRVALERRVLLIGFSAGAAFGGGAVLMNPARYLGMAMLCGTLPFDAAVPTPPGRLLGSEVFLAHRLDDTMIPRTLLERTWAYLTAESGARCRAERYEGDHGVSTEMLSGLSAWLDEIIPESGRP